MPPMPDDATTIKAHATGLARGLGFARVGVAPPVAARPERFAEFLARGLHADMHYLARNPSARADARHLLPEARSVMCLAVSYAPDAADESSGLIARYARGRDYHRVLRARCRKLLAALVEIVPDLKARICVDTAPLLERDLAAQAGLGWIGRNGCLIDPQLGSYLLLAEIVTNLPLPPDGPVADRCGGCRACIDACPAGAIGDDGLLDCRRCASYLTIEHRGAIGEPLRKAMGRNVFGCDACQAACPFNRRAPAGDAALRGPSDLARTPLGEILDFTDADWDRLTRGSAARRATREMFARNAAIAVGNTHDQTLRRPLKRLAESASAVVAEAARWALARVGAGGQEV